MNNIYVDELPKNCIECPFCKDIKVNGGMDRLLFCSAYKSNQWKLMKNIDKCFNKCEIKNKFKPLTDRLAEERKKVVQEIKDKISDGLYRNSYGETFINGDIYEILDQIERGE